MKNVIVNSNTVESGFKDNTLRKDNIQSPFLLRYDGHNPLVRTLET